MSLEIYGSKIYAGGKLKLWNTKEEDGEYNIKSVLHDFSSSGWKVFLIKNAELLMELIILCYNLSLNITMEKNMRRLKNVLAVCLISGIGFGIVGCSSTPYEAGCNDSRILDSIKNDYRSDLIPHIEFGEMKRAELDDSQKKDHYWAEKANIDPESAYMCKGDMYIKGQKKYLYFYVAEDKEGRSMYGSSLSYWNLVDEQ